MTKTAGKLTIETIRIVSEALRTRSMTHTAKAFGITQPAVTLHIKRFEEAFNVTLLRRVGNALVPTESALSLQASWQGLLEGVNTFELHLKRGVDRRKYVGISHNVFTALMAYDTDVQGLFQRYHLIVDYSSAIEQLFDAGELDVVIRPIRDSESDTEFELSVPFHWTGNLSPNLVRKGDSLPLPVVLSSKNSICHSKAIEYLDAHAIEYKILAQLGDASEIRKLVEAGFGYTFGPEFWMPDTIGDGSDLPRELKNQFIVKYGVFYLRREISHAAVDDIYHRAMKSLEKARNKSHFLTKEAIGFA